MPSPRALAFVLAIGACSERPPNPSATRPPSEAAPRQREPDATPATPATCEDGDPALQRYGTDCVCCHKWEFGVAGSVDQEGPQVTRIEVTDENGVTAVMQPNGHSNFFRHYLLQGPLRVTVYGPDGGALTMRSPAPDGACNRCHRPGGIAPRVHGP